MKILVYLFASLSMLLAACGPAAPATVTVPAPTKTTVAPTTVTVTAPTKSTVPSATPLLPDETSTPQPSLTPLYPPEGYGPSDFPSDVNPLTGLQVANPALLDRRPMIVKVSNLPRTVRPQFGLSLADIVFEYYTEAGSTRFAAVFYGNDAEKAGTIRSGRFFDTHIVRGYKAIFAFGSAFYVEMDQFVNSEFYNRLVVEGPNSPMFRYDPDGLNYLLVNTADLSAYITARGVENGRQNLEGMSFNLAAPAGGQPGEQVTVRYSASIYNRWDYDASSGKYLRFSDTLNNSDIENEQYAQLTDRLTGQPIAVDNVVVLNVTQATYSTDSKGNKIYDIQFIGSGDGTAFRDGQAYQVKWQRKATDVVSLKNPDGTPFPFKPGTTWIEVVGVRTTVQRGDSTWRFLHLMP